MSRSTVESDWKKFSKRAPEWRERFLGSKNIDVLTALSNVRKTPTERFWEAKVLMDELSDTLHACLDGHSRSKMETFLLTMLDHEMIDESDLVEFSQELRERITFIFDRSHRTETGGRG